MQSYSYTAYSSVPFSKFSFYIRCKGDLEVKQCAPQKAISGIRCPEVANYSSTGEIFLLRCNSQEETVNKTKCDEFAKVTCGKA